jgi:hypothetical protein
MKRKKLLELSEKPEMIFSDQKIKITKSGGELIFEIGREITTDIAEGVSLMMKICDKNSKVWNLEITTDEEITPAKCLYWLSGGIKEWKSLENYNKNWSECYLDFQEEFGMLILNIIKKSKRLSDIRDGFSKYLNLPILYEFAMSKNIIKI